MPKAVPERFELPYHLIELIRFRFKQRAIDLRPFVPAKHAADLIQREASHLPQGDQRQAIEHVCAEQPTQSAPAERLDQAFLLIEPQPGGRHPAAFRDLGNIQKFHS